GVHATRTGDIGLFRITSESGIAAGVRRLEAVTGQGAIDFTERQQDQLDDAAQLVKSDAFSVADKLRALLDRSKQLEKELQQLKDKAAAQESANLVHNTVDVKGTKLLVSLLQGGDAKALRTMVDDLKNQLGSGIVVLGLVQDDKVSLIAGVTKDLVGSVKAGELVNMLALQVGGKGGGRPDMAQAGGSDVQALPEALASVQAWVTERL
ncbi:MAG: DHHA1 domain-containing protein, partial [Plesiomonas sp.]